MKILLTGFELFGAEQINPSMEAVKETRDTIGDARIIKVFVPVVFKEAVETVYEAMKIERPDAVLCLGQAGGRSAMTPERVAINCDDARIPDNKGDQPVDVPVAADGPAAYFSSLPIKKMVEYMNKAGVPAAVSDSAGTYVCNHLMYGVLHHIDKEFPDMIGGFMHVPYLPEQVIGKNNVPSLAQEEIVKGIEAALQAIIDTLKETA